MFKLDEIPKGIYNSVFSARQPIGGDKEYVFPTDTSSVTPEELSSLMLKITSWASYSIRQLTLVNAKKERAKWEYDQLFRPLIVEEKAKTKDKIVAEAHAKNPQLNNLEEELRALSVEEYTWQKILSTYDLQLDVIQRELSRRATELRALGR